MSESFLGGKVILHSGDCLDVMTTLEQNSFDACVCDPPYGLGFMGKAWDRGVPGVKYWKAVLRLLKPGAHLIAFGGTRTFGRMHVAIEDAGFELRDMISWLYGSGFPKSLDVSKALDKAAGVEREIIATGAPVKRMIPGAEQHKDGWEKNSGRTYVPNASAPVTDAAQEWEGWGTALKPAFEPIVLARKPLAEDTVAANVLRWGTGALNIDGCRVEASPGDINQPTNGSMLGRMSDDSWDNTKMRGTQWAAKEGRWPANVVTDGSDEVVGMFPETVQSGNIRPYHSASNGYEGGWGLDRPSVHNADSGSAARFFYTAKADADDRLGSKHPTIKPIDLMQWLVRLVTPPGGMVLDPFAGTGTTGEAAFREGMRAVLIESEAEYQKDIRRRMALAVAGVDTRKRESARARTEGKPEDHGPLFAASIASGENT